MFMFQKVIEQEVSFDFMIWIFKLDAVTFQRFVSRCLGTDDLQASEFLILNWKKDINDVVHKIKSITV